MIYTPLYNHNGIVIYTPYTYHEAIVIMIYTPQYNNLHSLYILKPCGDRSPPQQMWPLEQLNPSGSGSPAPQEGCRFVAAQDFTGNICVNPHRDWPIANCCSASLCSYDSMILWYSICLYGVNHQVASDTFLLIQSLVLLLSPRGPVVDSRLESFPQSFPQFWKAIWLWLVVGPPLWKIWTSIGMISNPIYGNIKNGNQTTKKDLFGFTNCHRSHIAIRWIWMSLSRCSRSARKRLILPSTWGIVQGRMFVDAKWHRFYASLGFCVEQPQNQTWCANPIITGV